MTTRERPTAAFPSRDLSGLDPGTSAARYDIPIRACVDCGTFPCHCKAPRTLPCTCGGSVTSGPGEHAIHAAVKAHNATARHEAWRVRRRLA